MDACTLHIALNNGASSFLLRLFILFSSFCSRIKGLTSDLIGQLDSTSDGREDHNYLIFKMILQ